MFKHSSKFVALATLLAFAGCANAPADASSEVDHGVEPMEGRADEGGQHAEWSAGTGKSWNRVMNLVHYVHVPVGAAEEVGVCSGTNTLQTTLASILAEQYLSPLNSSGNVDVVDEARSLELQFRQDSRGAIQYRLNINLNTTVNEDGHEETYESSILVDFPASATAQNPATATILCAG